MVRHFEDVLLLLAGQERMEWLAGHYFLALPLVSMKNTEAFYEK